LRGDRVSGVGELGTSKIIATAKVWYRYCDDQAPEHFLEADIKATKTKTMFL
jgi:hypothetical protein